MDVVVCAGYAICFYLIYKAIDWLWRLPRINGYSNRCVFVTGCDSGFGNGIAKRLDALGFHVYAGCLTVRGEEELQKACSKRLTAFHLDVSDEKSIENAFRRIQESDGQEKALWAIINNAGIRGPNGPCTWTTVEDYNKIMAVNFFAHVRIITAFLPLLLKSKGRIINIASIYGRFSSNLCVPYCVSKFAVEAMSDGYRRQLRSFGVSVHLIEPGFFQTPIMNTEGIRQEAEENWQTMPPAMKKYYDRNYLEKKKVVNALEHAVTGRFPRARYVVGTDAKLFWLPLQWLPEWISDRLTMLTEPPLASS